MERVIELNNEKFYLRVMTGLAVSARRETIRHRNISVSGGQDGYVSGNHVHVDPIKIDEQVTEEILQDFVLLGLDGVEHEFGFKDEKYSVNVRPGNIVSVVHGSKTEGGKTAPYMIYNHNTQKRGTLNAFVEATNFSSLRLLLVGGGGLLLAFLMQMPWYGYLVLAGLALGLHYLWFNVIGRRKFAGDYLLSDECRDWFASLNKNDDAYRAMIAPAPLVSQG